MLVKRVSSPPIHHESRLRCHNVISVEHLVIHRITDLVCSEAVYGGQMLCFEFVFPLQGGPDNSPLPPFPPLNAVVVCTKVHRPGDFSKEQRCMSEKC